MKIVFFGLSITSSWGNGHATTYRALIRALATRGHAVTFIEKDVEWYRNNRDLPKPGFCKVILYEEWESEAARLVREARDADVVVIGSYFPDAVAAGLELFAQGLGPVLFYDIDTPITVGQLRRTGKAEYLDAALIPFFAAYLSFTGGPILRELEQSFGAQRALAFYCSVDAALYKPQAVREEFRCDLSYLGTYAADRQAKLVDWLDGAAARLAENRFLVAGSLYPQEVTWRENVRRIEHVAPRDHPGFYSSSRFSLNLTREEMVRAGYSPSVRLFEASACGSTILSDSWAGLTELFTPGEEILLPRDANDVVAIVRDMPDDERSRLGMRARERVLAEHTSAHRAMEFERIVDEVSGVTLNSRGKQLAERVEA